MKMFISLMVESLNQATYVIMIGNVTSNDVAAYSFNLIIPLKITFFD